MHKTEKANDKNQNANLTKYTHQLPAVAHHLQLDRQPVALGAHAGQFGRQPLTLAPQRGHIRIHRGRGPGVALGPAPVLVLVLWAIVRSLSSASMLRFQFRAAVGLTPSPRATCALVAPPDAYSITALRRVSASTGA